MKRFLFTTALAAFAAVALVFTGCGGKGGGGGGEKPSELSFSPEANLTAPVAAGATVGVFDAEGDVPITWFFAEGEGSDDNGEFEIVGDELKVGSVPLEAREYKFRVTASNSRGSSDSVSFTLTVSPAAEAPDVTGVTDVPHLLREGLFAADAVAADLSAQGGTSPFTWEFDASDGKGTDNGNFNLNSATGALSVKSADLEKGVYDVQVKVTDSKDKTYIYAFTIEVHDASYVPDPPAELDFAPASPLVAPLTAGTTVGTLSADTEAGPLEWALVSGDGDTHNGKFEIAGNLVKTKEAVSNGTYNFRVEAKDTEDQTASAAFSVTVTAPAAPTGLNFVAEADLVEPVAVNDKVGTLSATGTGALTYTLVGDGADAADNASFKIVGTEVQANGELTAKTYSFRVQVSDDFGGSMSAAFTVTVEEDDSSGPVSNECSTIEELEAYLASVEPNDADTPYMVHWSGGDIAQVRDALWDAKKFIHLDLSDNEGSNVGWNIEWAYFQSHAINWGPEGHTPQNGWVYMAGITFPDDVTQIGSGIFAGNDGFANLAIRTVVLNNVTHINGWAPFQDCWYLSEVDWGGIVSMEGGAFTRTGILEAIMPSTFTNLGNLSFQDAQSLHTLSLPGGVNIHGEAFGGGSGCSKLATVIFRGKVNFGDKPDGYGDRGIHGNLVEVYNQAVERVDAGEIDFPLTFLANTDADGVVDRNQFGGGEWKADPVFSLVE